MSAVPQPAPEPTDVASDRDLARRNSRARRTLMLKLLGFGVLLAYLLGSPTAGTPLIVWQIALALFTVVVILDVRLFGLGLVTMYLLALAIPAYTIVLLGPYGLVSPWFDLITGYVGKRLDLLFAGTVYFYLGVSIVAQLAGKQLATYDTRIVAQLEAQMASPALTTACCILAIATAFACFPNLPLLLRGAAYGTAASAARSLPFMDSGTQIIAQLACALAFFGVGKALRKFTIAFVPAQLLLNYRRANSMTLLALYLWRWAVLTPNDRAGRHTRRQRVVTALWASAAIGAVYFVLVGVGWVRTNASSTYGGGGGVAGLVERLGAGIVGGTVQGSVYAAAVAAEVGATTPEPRLPGLFIELVPNSLLPGPPPRLGPASLRDQGLTIGGMMVPFEAYMSHQLPGLLLSPFLFCLALFGSLRLLRWIFGPLGESVGWMAAWAVGVRTCWYGILYLLSSILLAATFLCLFLQVTKLFTTRRTPAPGEP